MVSFVSAACAVTAKSSATALIQREKLRGVAAEDCRFVCTRNLQCGDAGEHLLQASDLMRIVAAGQDVSGAGELDGQPQRARVEIDRVVIELLQVGAGRAVDVCAALAEGVESAVEALDEV